MRRFVSPEEGTTSRGSRAARRVQARAGGGSFNPGWLLTGEQGPELEYRTEGGFIAHNRALLGMLAIAERTRAAINDVSLASHGGTAAPSLAYAASGPSSGPAPMVTFAPQYNVPITVTASSDSEAVRQVVREELHTAQEPATQDLGRLLHD